jgi:hypothetical protein
MGRMASTIYISLVLVLSALIVPMGIDDKVEGVGEPDIIIQIAQPKQTVYVAPGQDGIVTFTGTVFAEIPYDPSIQYLIVQLHANAGGWPVSNPPALTFSRAQKQQSFTISVQVPIGTSSGGSYQLEVGGTWHYSPGVMSGEVDPAHAIIVIDQYYDYDLGSEDLFNEALRGEVIKPVIDVRNAGNGNDEISLEIVNTNDLYGSGIEALFSDDTVVVTENETVGITLFVKCGESMHKGSYPIEIKAHSAIAEERGEICPTETLTIYVDVVDMKSEPEPEPMSPVTLYPPVEKTHESLEIEWSEYTGSDFDRYAVYISESNDPGSGYPVDVISNKRSTILLIEDLEPDINYRLMVRTYNEMGDHADSNIISGRTLELPKEPEEPEEPDQPADSDETEEPVIEDPEIENNLEAGDLEQDSGSSSIIVVAVLLVIVLFVCIGLGVFFYIRAGKKKEE